MSATHDLADTIVDLSVGAHPEAVAKTLDSLIWCLADNGHQIILAQERWLRAAQDKHRVEIALAMNETFPFQTLAEMSSVFSHVCSVWPELETHCDRTLKERRLQNPTAP